MVCTVKRDALLYIFFQVEIKQLVGVVNVALINSVQQKAIFLGNFDECHIH